MTRPDYPSYLCEPFQTGDVKRGLLPIIHGCDITTCSDQLSYDLCVTPNNSFMKWGISWNSIHIHFIKNSSLHLDSFTYLWPFLEC